MTRKTKRSPRPLFVAPLSFSLFLQLSGCTGPGLTLFGGAQEKSSIEKGETFQTSALAFNTEDEAPPSFGQLPFSANTGRGVIATPTVEDVLATGDVPEMFLGRADAPVTIVFYASLSCPYCRAFWQDIFPRFKKEYIERGKVRFVIREFPIGKSSGNATIALRCAPSDQYFTLFTKYLENQSSWVSQEVRLNQIFAVAQQVGMKREKFDACLQNQSLIDSLQRVKDRGRKLGIVGTPNFFIQNHLVKKTLTLEEMRALVDPLLSPVQASRLKDPSGSH